MAETDSPKLSCALSCSYGFGFVAASLCSRTVSCYIVLFFHHVLQMDNNMTGYIIFAAKVCEAAATCFVALLSDKFNGFCCYPKWKSVHLIGKFVFCAIVNMNNLVILRNQIFLQ